MSADTDRAADRLTVEGQRFAIVPEWVIDADIGDAAFRLYAVLLRYGQSSGQRMPSRATLARRLRKRSVDTVDRAMRELVVLGAVVVERRTDGRRNLTNLYHLRTSDPGRTDAAAPRSSRTTAATTGRTAAATPRRTGAATPAAPTRPDPGVLTESTPPPIPLEVVERVRQLRRDSGLPLTRWAPAAIGQAAVRAADRGWPTERLLPALLAVAAEPSTVSPARVAEAGPWWDEPTRPAEDLSALEAELDLLDGYRALVQRRAREELAAEGVPLTRTTVLRRAVQLARATHGQRAGSSYSSTNRSEAMTVSHTSTGRLSAS